MPHLLGAVGTEAEDSAVDVDVQTLPFYHLLPIFLTCHVVEIPINLALFIGFLRVLFF
jgi:hypothetical protein